MENKKEINKKIMTIFLVFLIACIIGWIYEIIFYRIDTGGFVKRGQGFGPWLPIYGVGSLLILLLTSKRKSSPVGVFLISALSTGVLELVVGWALFNFGNIRLWDYNIEIWNWGNIGGYVCLRSILLFAVMGIVLYYFVYPKMSELTEKIKYSTLKAITIPLAILFSLDIIFGYLVKPILY